MMDAVQGQWYAHLEASNCDFKGPLADLAMSAHGGPLQLPVEWRLSHASL